MTLYHGSNVAITEIDLQKGRKGKDFGRGFYLSDSKKQAMLMASRTVDREGCGTPIVTRYIFNENILNTPPEGIKTKVFEGYTEEWAKFIIQNRQNKTSTQVHPYDIVYGPIADDQVGLQLNLYLLRYINIKELIERLKFKRPTYQYFFGTAKSLGFLERMDR